MSSISSLRFLRRRGFRFSDFFFRTDHRMQGSGIMELAMQIYSCEFEISDIFSG